jgi:hypothetical protein
MLDHSEESERAHWRMTVHNMLRAGFGVEDISVKLFKLKMPWWRESAIRDEVRELRSSGKLMEVLSLHRRKREALRPVPSTQDHQDHEPTEGSDQV